MLLQGVAPGKEFPRPLIHRLTPPISFLGLLDGPGAGLPGGRQQLLSLLIVEVTLVAREGNSRLQLAPLFSQAQALGLKARVFIIKLFTKLAHRVSRPPEKPLAKSVTLPGTLEYVFHTIICPKQAPGATNQHSPSELGAGGWRP